MGSQAEPGNQLILLIVERASSPLLIWHTSKITAKITQESCLIMRQY